MPLYEFTCLDCDKTFEVARPITESSNSVPCPNCGSTRTEKTWSRVFAVTAKKS